MQQLILRAVVASALLVVLMAGLAGHTAVPAADARGTDIVKVKSLYAFDETIAKLKADIAGKGITYFFTVEQSKLANATGLSLRPQSLLVFGNPGLGGQFLTSNPVSGLDWPVRLLVWQDADGSVWTAYTDFAHIAHRHNITDRGEAFAMTTKVIGSITSAIASR